MIFFRNFIVERKDRIVLFQTLHTYGQVEHIIKGLLYFAQLVLLPWHEKQPANHKAITELAERGAQTMKNIHGKTYQVNQILRNI